MRRLTVLWTIFLLAACSSHPAVTSTEMIPTVTPVPLFTPTITSVPSYTPTITPVPSSTSIPISTSLPGPVIPEGLGLTIQFLEDRPWEFDKIAEAGFRFVRVDAPWDQIELTKGVYDFSATDVVVESLRKRNIRILFILGRANPLYDNGFAPFTDQGRTAFAQFAATIAARYAGRGIIWDFWDEPNGDWSWKPTPNVQNYAKLAMETIDAIRQADPNAIVVGIGLCCFESMDSWGFYDELGKLGVLNKFDAVSIHPYGSPTPETAADYYSYLRQILHKYSPEKQIPIIDGEWGFSTAWTGLSETPQAEYLVRSWLVNLANDVNLSIWYDWSDDCVDQKDVGCHFGVVYSYMHPKAAYLAAQTMIHTLDGYHFLRRIVTTNTNDYLFLFSKNNESVLVAWTTAASHTFTLALSGDSLARISMTGETTTLIPDANAFAIELNSSPQYLLVGARTIP